MLAAASARRTKLTEEREAELIRQAANWAVIKRVIKKKAKTKKSKPEHSRREGPVVAKPKYIKKKNYKCKGHSCFSYWQDNYTMMRHFVAVHKEEATEEERVKYTRRDTRKVPCPLCKKKLQEG